MYDDVCLVIHILPATENPSLFKVVSKDAIFEFFR